MNKKFLEIKNKPISECKKKIPDLWGTEYASQIVDYGKEKVAVTDRYIQPYITSETHGAGVFNGIVQLVNHLGVKNVFDLGCAAGEMLHEIKKSNDSIDLYGCTIHLGEVEYARNNFGLENVVGIDMRDIDEYFDEGFFDCIIVHCSFSFIVFEDRIATAKKIHKLLKKGGYFIYVDYRGEKDSEMPPWNWEYYYDLHELDISVDTMGYLTIYRKK